MSRVKQILDSVMVGETLDDVAIATISKIGDLSGDNYKEVVALSLGNAVFHNGLDSDKIYADTTEKDVREYIDSILVGRGDFIQVIQVGSTVVGIAVCQTWLHYGSKRLHVCDVFIHEDYRRFGLAKLLLDSLSEYKTSKRLVITLAVHANNEPAIALYSKLGFVDKYRNMQLIVK